MPPAQSDSPREVVTCRLRPELIQRLDVAAKADKRSRSEMIEIAVEKMLDAAVKKTSKNKPIVTGEPTSKT